MPERVWRVFYDGSCGFCRRSQRWMARRVRQLPVLFLDGTVEGLKPEEFTELRLKTPDGREFRGFLALVTLFRAASRVPALWGLLTVPPIVWLGNGIYRLVARHRHRLACKL